MNWWHAMHRLRWPVRSLLKLVTFALTVVVVLYPRFWLLPTWWARLANLEALIEPDHPGLQPLEATVRQALGEKSDSQTALSVVQSVVYDRIPYAWDWEVWGVMDYVPTVAEVLEKGREDCDGRAVLAASLLRRMGYQATLVSDMVHMWVSTPAGETMSPGHGPKTLQATPGKTLLRWRGLMRNFLRATTFGIAVFPLSRELIIAVALCLLSMHPWSSPRRRVAGCAGILLGLWVLRMGGAAAADSANLGLAACGVGLAGAGWLLLVLRGAGRHWPAKRAESPRLNGPVRY